MSKDKGKDKDTPKARGGRRRQKPVAEASLANLRKFQPGQSGNPAGKSKSVVEMTREAREMVPGALQQLNAFIYDESAPVRDRITAAVAICDRGLGKPAIGIFHGNSASSPLEQTEDGAPVSALLRAARANPDERTLAELRAETRRIEAKLAQEREEHEAHLADAAEALAKGEEVDGLTALLLKARAANAEEPPPRPTPPRIEAKPDFIVDSAGHAAPAPLAESAPPTPAPESSSKSEDSVTTSKPLEAAKPPPFWIEDPPPAPTPTPKPAHPGASIPGFSEFLSERATTAADQERARKQEEVRRQGRPGGQLTREEAFPPDPRELPEVVTLGRIPGGRGIRRVS